MTTTPPAAGRRTDRRMATTLALAGVLLGACTSEEKAPTGATPSAVSRASAAPDPTPRPCAADQVRRIPTDDFDPGRCQSLGRVMLSTLEGDTVWFADSGLRALDLKTGKVVFSAPELGTKPTALKRITVGETPSMAVIYRQEPAAEQGKSSTQRGIRLIAYPLDAAPGATPTIDVTNWQVGPDRDGQGRWGSDAVSIDDLRTPYSPAAFVKGESVSGKPGYRLPETSSGSSEWASATADSTVLWVEGWERGDDGKASSQAVGFVALDASNGKLWDALNTFPADDRLSHFWTTWGHYGLQVAIDPDGREVRTVWTDLRTGQEAKPTPADFADAPYPNDGSASHDSRHLSFRTNLAHPAEGQSFVLDIESGELHRVEADRELTIRSSSNTTAYALPKSSTTGVSIDLATAKVTPMPDGKVGPLALSESYGIWLDENNNLLTAPTTE